MGLYGLMVWFLLLAFGVCWWWGLVVELRVWVRRVWRGCCRFGFGLNCLMRWVSCMWFVSVIWVFMFLGVRDVMIAVLVILVGYFGLCVLVCWVFYLWFGVIYTFASLFWVGLVFWFSESVLLDDLGGYVRLRWCLHMLLGEVVGGGWDSVGGFCDLWLFAYAIGAGR